MGKETKMRDLLSGFAISSGLKGKIIEALKLKEHYSEEELASVIVGEVVSIITADSELMQKMGDELAENELSFILGFCDESHSYGLMMGSVPDLMSMIFGNVLRLPESAAKELIEDLQKRYSQ
jgi:hypothetical protein